jgi:hypothetical protein
MYFKQPIIRIASEPIFDDESNIIGVFGVDIRFEDLVRAE